METIESGVVGYKRRIDRQGGERHRKSDNTKKYRQTKKLADKNNWFKYKTQENKEGGKGKGDRTTQDSNTRKYWEKRDKRKTDNNQDRQRQPATVMFIPRTSGGELAKRLKD